MTFFLLKKTDKQKLFFFTVYLMKVSGVQFCFDPEILQKCLILYSVKEIHTGFELHEGESRDSVFYLVYLYIPYLYIHSISSCHITLHELQSSQMFDDCHDGWSSFTWVPFWVELHTASCIDAMGTLPREPVSEAHFWTSQSDWLNVWKLWGSVACHRVH